MNAVNRLGIVPIRAKLSDTSEMTSQMVYGERCYIKESHGIWSLIKMEYDGYEGWVDSAQLSDPDSKDEPFHVVLAPFIEWNGQYLPMGSELPDPMVSVMSHPPGLLRPAALRMTADEIAQHAHKFLRSPYLWGGRTVFGVDCSGLTQILYKTGGHRLPRDSGEQEKCGRTVDSLESSLSGDLAFFSKPGKHNISHVGIILREKNKVEIIHASSWVKKDRLTEEGILSTENALTHSLVSVKRIIE